MNRLQLRKLRNILDGQFAETYYEAINAVEGSAMSFVALNGDRVTVQNGRRLIVVKAGEPFVKGYTEDGLCIIHCPKGFN